MSFWKNLKETFFGAPLRTQFEQLLVEEEARNQGIAPEAETKPVKKEKPVAKAKKPAAAKPAAKPAAKAAAKPAKAAAKPAAKGKKK
jgi:hypothetical protein